MTDWKPLAATLVDDLAGKGLLTDPRWRQAFLEVPRHVFVPRFYDDDGVLIDSGDPTHRDGWLKTVYSDESLITQQAPVQGTDLVWPTSSSTMPSLMARMLQLLDAYDDRTVLEIGTGTGYNAALLSHRLGDAHVVSIDLDPALIAAAHPVLAGLGYRPHLVAGDGAGGVPERAPYDRIIATCAVPAIPPVWIEQLDHNGLIVADIRGDLASNLIVLRKTEPDTAEGRFLPVPGHFMWLRSEVGNPLRDGGRLSLSLNIDNPDEHHTAVDPALLHEPSFRFVVQLHLPDLNPISRNKRDGTETLTLATDDGSWSEITTTGTDGRYPVAQGGPRRLWTRVEQAARMWASLGQPAPNRFGITAAIDASKQRLWLDHPESPNSWPLPL